MVRYYWYLYGLFILIPPGNLLADEYLSHGPRREPSLGRWVSGTVVAPLTSRGRPVLARSPPSPSQERASAFAGPPTYRTISLFGDYLSQQPSPGHYLPG